MLFVQMVDLKKFLPGKDEADKREYFWSIVIEPGWVQAGIWRIEEERAQVVLSSPPSAWEGDEELIQASDSCLSSAIQGFPEDQKEPQKTVFGVSSSWVSEGEIKTEYLDKIKKLCDELSLVPIGFVVLPEAIANLVKSNEGSPPNAVFLGVYESELEITLFRLGSLSGTTQVARSVSLADDVAEGLARFIKSGNIPSRLILYNGKQGELEEARQALLKVNWEEYKSLKFLHTPKVEIIDANTKVHAVCLAGASELANVKNLQVVSELPEEQAREIKEETSIGDQEPGSAQSPEGLGFVMDKDISKVEEPKIEAVEEEQIFDESDENLRNIQEPQEPSRPMFQMSMITGAFESASGFVRRLVGSLGNLGKIFSGGSTKPLIVGGAFLAVLIIAGFLLWWFLPKAVVTLYVSPQRLEESIDLRVDADTNTSDIGNGVLAGQEVETTVEGERTKDTSGTKTVGERATGEVTLYRVGPQLNIPAGAVLTGPSDLEFTLDNQVTVASGSAGTPGTTNAPVTASDIGAQYNLAEGATFSVSNFSTSDIEAKNENAFSGGSSREINAVSEEDQEILEEELEDELIERARGELNNGLSEEVYLIDESLAVADSSREFNHRVGDEATTLQLDLTLDTMAVTINKEELINLAQEALKDKVPKGFVLRGEQVNFEFNLEDTDESEYEFRVRVSANLLPEIDTEEVAERIKGKYTDVANEYLIKEVPGFIRAEVSLRPNLPGRLRTLPRLARNIEVEISAER